MKKGFTLAEILVTLVTIGVLAALSIPSLVNNINDQQNKITWRKAFSDLSQVTMRVMVDNGGTFKGAFSSCNSVRDSYIGYLNYVKTCNPGGTKGNCWNSIGGKNLTTGEQWQTTSWWFDSDSCGAILNNGIYLYFQYNSSIFKCSNSAPSYKECARIFIDLNGISEPNTLGKDIYFTNIYEDRLAPERTGNCIGSDGAGCSAIYLYQ